MDDDQAEGDEKVEEKPNINHLQIGSLWKAIVDLDCKGDQHKHRGEVDCDYRFKVVVFIVVGAEADDVEDGGGDEDVGGDAKQLPTKDQANLDSFNAVPLHFNLNTLLHDLVLL